MYLHKKNFLIPAFAAFILMISFILHSFLQQPVHDAENYLQLFLESFHIRKDVATDSMVSASINDRTFISFYRNSPSVEFEIARTKNAGPNQFRTSVLFVLPEGRITGTFKTLKTDSGYVITQMPHISCVKCGLPLLLKEKKKTKTVYLFDISGRRYLLESASGLFLEPFKPVSLLLMDGSILNASPLKHILLDKVLSQTDAFLETMTGGSIRLDSDFHVYETAKQSCSYKTSGRIPPGTEQVSIYGGSDNTAMAAVYLQNGVGTGTIRVALGTSSYRSLEHNRIELGCRDGFILETRVAPQIRFEFTPSQRAVLERMDSGIHISCSGKDIAFTKNRIYAIPRNSKPMLFYGIERSHTTDSGYTAYEGTIDVFPAGEGLVAVNEISLSRYLCSVVSGEMPASFGIEPLKAQAVAARTYAVRSILDSAFSGYGANIDDSTYSQVYGNTPVGPGVETAVNATAGQVLFFRGQVADTRYFSTSCGYTASSCDVWADNDGSFPGTPVEYLESKPQVNGKAQGINSEHRFMDFISNPRGLFYDSISPFFRWKTVFDAAQIEETVKKSLGELWKIHPQFILTQDSSGEYISIEVPVKPGRLYDIVPVKRGSGGNIIEMVLVMSSGSYKIVKELNIRRILRPAKAVMLSDGSVRQGLPLLPSTFAVIETQKNSDGTIDTITIEGGGFGHGVGMSQYGAYGMSLAGALYEQILSHYYPGTVLKKIY